MRKRLIVLALLLLIGLGFWGRRWAKQSAPRKTERGGELAQVYCAACHQFPSPDLLDKTTWRNQTLPYMRGFMGLAPIAVNNNPDADFLKQTGAFMESPLISEKDLALIAAYYNSTAPEQMASPVEKAEITVGLKSFSTKPQRYRTQYPGALMVQIDAEHQQIYVGNAQRKSIDILSSEGMLESQIPAEDFPVAVAIFADGIYVTNIGDFFPRERPAGNLLHFKKNAGGFDPPEVVLDKLVRPVDTNFADLNEDGNMDFVLSLFGNFGGRFSWYENDADGGYEEHVLFPKPGALGAEILDLNGDGHLDIAVLIAQSTETLFFMYGDGAGNFTTSIIFQHPPVHGHTYFELTDFDLDGDLDVVVTNGDNGEFTSPPLKNYHGIRIYLNDGNNQFEERFFYPLNGAFKAMARDFDQDGDMDIAAISYFPDYRNTPDESFVYLENKGDFQFTSSTFDERLSGRWMTMDSGDVDGDGDEDIVLGSVVTNLGLVPNNLKKSWNESGTTIVILENTTVK